MSLTPKSWASFQHYKDRSPIWIKLHRALLDNYEFHCLPVASRALAPMLWLLASEYEGGRITLSIPAIAFRLRMSGAEIAQALKPLITGGFFIDDSATLADGYHDAIPEKERETQEKTETEPCGSADADATVPAKKRIEYSKEFNEFWLAYPRTPNMSKDNAWKVWKRLSPEDRLLAAAAVPVYIAWIKDINGKRRDPHPIVHAERFLSQRRFEGFGIAPAAVAVEGHFVKDDSPERDAWNAYGRAIGKKYPAGMKSGGWFFPSQWPPKEDANVSSMGEAANSAA